MKTFFTNLITLTILAILFSFNVYSQGIALSYERDLTDIDYLEGTYGLIGADPGQAIMYTSNGFALYYGSEKTGFDDFIKLRNNNTIVWKTQVDKYPDNITPYRFYEHESGYFFVGDFAIGSHNGGIGRLNKSTGNFEVKKKFTDLQSAGTFAINGTHNGNIIIGGSTDIGNSQLNRKAMVRVVNSLGEVLTTRTSNNTNGIWGNVVEQIEKTYDNGYIISGFIFENTICGEPNNSSWWICKLNSNLDVVWSRKYGSSNGTTRADKIVILENNEIVALGQTYCTNGNGGGINNTGEGKWLVKLNSSGNISLYKQDINILIYDVLHKRYFDIALSCDNKLLLAGRVSENFGSFNFLEKYDFNFDLIPGSEVNLMEIYPYVIPSDNLEILAGNDNSYLLSGLKTLTTNNNFFSFIAKTIPDPSCGNNPNPLLCETNVGQFSICEDFEKLQPGNIVPQGSPKFSLFSGDNDENASVTTEKAFSGNKSLKFTTISDIDFNIDRTIESPSRMEWMTNLDAGKTGSWGLETSSPTAYALVTRLNNGQGIVYTISSSNQLEQRGTFAYTPGQWFKTALVFNNTDNTIEIWGNDKMIYSRPGHTSRQITDLNFYGTSGSTNNLLYIDDLLYYETKIPCTCTSEYSPVCVNGKEYSNSCRAACAGYTSNEWKLGGCGGSTTSITLDIDDNVCGTQNAEIEVPVRVKNYNNIAGLQLKISSSNNNTAEITGVTNINSNSGLGNIDFAVVDKKLVLTYADAEKTLSDNTILFSVKVRLKGAVNSTANLNFEGDLKALDTNGAPVTVTGVQGSVCVSQTVMSVSGRITNTKDKGISNANVIVTTGSNQVTTKKSDNTGQFTITDLISGTNYKIKPNFTEPLANGVDISDLFILRRHMQGLSLFSSPYTYLAADMNVDKQIDISDLFLMRRIMQGLTTELPNNQPAWRFVPKSYSFPASGNPLSGTIPDAFDYTPLTSNQSNQHFSGVKYGDLDHSLISFNNPLTENRSAADVELNIGSVTGASGSTVTLEVKCKNFIKGEVLQFSIQWPTDKLELVNVPSGADIVIPGTTTFDQTQLAQGKLGLFWETDNNSGGGTTLSDNSVVYRLKFKLIGSNNTTAMIENSTTPKPAKFLDVNFTEIPLRIGTGTVTIAATSASVDENADNLIKIYPNPTTGIISIESDNNEIKNLEVRSLDGRIVQRIFELKGSTIDLSNVVPGTYILKGVTNNYPFAKKLVILR